MGKKFLAASTMQELAAVFGKEKEFLERQVSCFRFTFFFVKWMKLCNLVIIEIALFCEMIVNEIIFFRLTNQPKIVHVILQYFQFQSTV